jgi:hypothetical protein
MIFYVLSWCFLATISFPIGSALILLFRVNCAERMSDRFFVASWLGITTLAVVLLTVSLIVPLSQFVGFAVAAILVFLSLIAHSVRSCISSFFQRIPFVFFFVFLSIQVIVALFLIKIPPWIDPGLYHIGFIRWLAEYGAVPGVALLHSRFGFSSSWFALAAPFNSEDIGYAAIAVTNGFIFSLTTFHFFVSAFSIFTKRVVLSDWLVISWSIFMFPVFILWRFGREMMASPSNDFPVIVLSGVIFWMTVIIISNDKWKEENSFLNSKSLLVYLAGLTTAIKLSAIPILAVVLLFFTFERKISLKRKLQRFFFASTIIVLTLLPTSLYGVIATGCPLFPSSIMCIPLPWTIQQSGQVAGWYKIRGTSFSKQFLPLRILDWLHDHPANPFLMLMILLSILGAWRLLSSRLRPNALFIWPILIGMMGILFIMIKSPFPRFMLAYSFLVPSLWIASLLHDSVPSFSLNHPFLKLKGFSAKLFKKRYLLGLVCITSICILFLHRGVSLFPPALPKPQLISQTVNDIQYLSPVNDALCWGANLPCTTSTLMEQDIQLRLPPVGLRGGFMIRSRSGLSLPGLKLRFLTLFKSRD